MIYNLLKLQSALEGDIDQFYKHPIDYIATIFREVVENNIDVLRGCLTRLIK